MTKGQITLNGRFLLQPVTGVQRVAREVLMELDQLAAAGIIPAPRLLLPKRGAIIAPPALKAIVPQRVGWLSGYGWEQLELPLHAGRDPLLCLGNTAPVLRLMLPGRPSVTMVHDLSYKYFPKAYSRRFRIVYGMITPAILSWAERVVTVSRSEMDSITHHYPFIASTGRLSFLQNGGIQDADARRAFQADVPGPEARRYGLYVGSLTQRKNAEGILQAAVQFLRTYPDMRFVVIGTTAASFESVYMEVPPDLADRLEFRGQINDTQHIYDAYKGARFLLFPSFYEASPLPPIEAMTFGCPVVSSQIPSLTERCSCAAVYCEPDNLASITAAIDLLMNDQATWQRLSNASRVQAARYSWAVQAKGLLALCEEVE